MAGAERLGAAGVHVHSDQSTLATRADGPVTLGEFVLLCRLGEGGMCRVYKAYDRQTGRTVALKILRTRFARSREQEERFFDELRILRRLSHPNVVHAIRAGRRGRHRYLAVEYVEGISAAELAEGVELPLDEVVRIALDVLRGLDHAHGRGVLHCDVKPDNILIRRSDACVKLADFGLALCLHRSHQSKDERFTYGTPHYMPPEQLEDMSQVDERSDLYAFGATLYHLLTGRPPFEERTLKEMLRRKQRCELSSVRADRPEVPVELERLLRALLDPDPAGRPRSAAEVYEELDRLDLAAEGLPSVTGQMAVGMGDADATALEPVPVAADEGTKWYVRVDSRVFCVSSTEELEQLVRQGSLGLDTLVARGHADARPLPIRLYEPFRHLVHELGSRRVAKALPDIAAVPAW